MKTINTSATDSIRASIKNYSDNHNWLNKAVCFVIHCDDIVTPENRDNNLKQLVGAKHLCRRCGYRWAEKVKS